MKASEAFLKGLRFPPVFFTIAILVGYLAIESIGYAQPSLLSPPQFQLITDEETAPSGEEGSESPAYAFVLVIKESYEPLSFGFNGTHGGPPLEVKKGDLVRITIINEGKKVHNIGIPDLGIEMGYVQRGKSRSVEFVPSTSGHFSYFCAVDDHRWSGMEGILVVED